MKTIKRFQSFLESQDDVKIIIDDMLLEYMDKYNIFSVEDYNKKREFNSLFLL